jgi:hypothetical protein
VVVEAGVEGVAGVVAEAGVEGPPSLSLKGTILRLQFCQLVCSMVGTECLLPHAWDHHWV